MTVASDKIVGDDTTLRFRVIRRAQEKPEGVRACDWYAQISKEFDVSAPTIYRWLREADRGKVASDRAPVPVAVKAESGAIRVEVKSRAISPPALDYGLSLLANNAMLDVKRAYAEVRTKAEECCWEVGSLNSFYRAVQQVPDIFRTMARSGKRGVEALVKPPIRRDMSNINVYDILIGDQHIFDYIVLDYDGEPVRPQMYAWVDAKSRFFSGIWPVLGDYDQFAVGFSLREACRFGLPQHLYNDWGKPENSKYIDQLRRQFSGLSAFETANEEIDHLLPQINAKPRNAQAKAIESYFYHTFERPLMRRNLPGYARRDADEKRNDFIQESLRREVKGRKVLHAAEFFEIVGEVLDEWHEHTMSEDKTIPIDVFDAGTRKLIRFDDATLDFLCWPAKELTVRNSKVQMTLGGFGKCEWSAHELATLCSRNKKTKVEVRYNPYDASRVYILDLESHKQICIAERWGKVDPLDRSAVGNKIRNQNKLMKDISSVFAQLAKPETRVHRITPYAVAAAEIQNIEALREELIVNRDDVDGKIIHIANVLEAQKMAKAR